MTRTGAILGLALVGAAIALYLAAFQVGLIPTVWDPFFGDRARSALTSGLSRWLPIPDALLGAVAYAIDASLAAVLASRLTPERPTVAALAVIASLGGLAGLGLAISQVVLRLGPCTLCFASSAISVALALVALDEARVRLWAGRDRSASHPSMEVSP